MLQKKLENFHAKNNGKAIIYYEKSVVMGKAMLLCLYFCWRLQSVNNELAKALDRDFSNAASVLYAGLANNQLSNLKKRRTF
jgi:hypothetical protein